MRIEPQGMVLEFDVLTPKLPSLSQGSRPIFETSIVQLVNPGKINLVVISFKQIPGVPKKTIHCLISSNVKPLKAISIK